MRGKRVPGAGGGVSPGGEMDTAVPATAVRLRPRVHSWWVSCRSAGLSGWLFRPQFREREGHVILHTQKSRSARVVWAWRGVPCGVATRWDTRARAGPAGHHGAALQTSPEKL